VNILDLSTVSLADIIVFAVLAGATVGGALMTITRRNPVTAVMSLVGTFFALAGLYTTLNAHFLAVLQIMVYAGAIMVLFIFVVMILNRDEIEPVSFRGIITRVLGVVAIGYVVLVFSRVTWALRGVGPLATTGNNLPPDYGTVAGVGMSLFGDFVFPFEAISLLLLVAIVGGIVVSRSHKQEEQAEETARKLAIVHAQHGPESRVSGGVAALAPHGHGQGDDAAHAHAAHH
jgi:NADH-quinone oxidoreductase subunit J